MAIWNEKKFRNFKWSKEIKIKEIFEKEIISGKQLDTIMDPSSEQIHII